MFWFGWVPILTSKLLCEHALKQLRLIAVPLGKGEYFLPSKANSKTSSQDLFTENVRESIMAEIKKESPEIFYFFKKFSDISIGGLKRVAISIGEENLVRNIGIFSCPEFSMEALARVVEIEDTGLVKFEVKASGSEYIYAEHLFGEIRDIYHEHIYVPHGDFPLRPVRAADRSQALAMIFNQYDRKILLYHKIVKNLLEDLGNGYGAKSLRHFSHLDEIIASGRGEMIHAMSFANLFKLSETHLKSIQNSYNSLEVLLNKLNCLRALRSSTENTKLFFLTLLSTGFFTFSILQSKMCLEKSIIFSLAAMGFIWALMGFLNWFVTRKHKTK